MNTVLKKSLILLGIVALSTFSFSQSLNSVNPNNPKSDGDEQKLQMAVVLIMDGYLYEADKIVDELLISDPENAYYNYLKGFNSLYSAKDHEKALKHFHKTIDPEQGKLQLLEADSRVTNDVYYHTASAYQFLEDIDNAEKFYTTFLELSSKRSVLYKEAELRLKQCAVAKGLLASQTKIEVKLIDGAINTKFPEYSPVISADGNELYYTSRRAWANIDQSEYMYPIDNSYPEDVYFSVKDYDGTWGESVRLDLCSPLNNEASVSLTANMNTLYVYSDRAGNGNLFHSEYEKDDFASMDDIKYKELNTDSWEPHYVSSEDSTLIIFSSDRKGGEGGRDLWSIRKTNDGWTKPINLGTNVNTPQDEDAPFVSLDGEYLYYSSNGDKSMGGFDVMRAKINNLGQPAATENLGYPINSGGDDVFYSVTYDGTDAYFSSFRKGGVGENDIYHLHDASAPANVFALSGRVIDLTDDAKEIDLEVALVEKSSGKPVKVIVKRQSYFQLLEPCKEYSFEMTNKVDGEVLYTENIKTNCDGKPSQLVRNYYNGQYWLEGVLSDASTKAPIKTATIELVDKMSGSVIATLPSTLEGGFESPRFADLKPGDNMKIAVKISAPGYEAKTFEVDRLLAAEGKIHEDFDLAKEEVIASVDVSKYIIYFSYDKSNIRKSEVDLMNDVVKLMNDNPTMEIKLKSYTDAKGTDDYNNRLSKRRANSSLKYIQKKITNPNRITAQGMGESNPVNNCGEDCNDAQDQANRRTTFEIVKK
jgi:outer membrane protein OmpA-like peptidoglycan-associated protein/tetratricopeptide (TPR) repeat protein